ncbi:MAG: 16S rRNA (uracil(1498)-N(3))-methyltransferase [Spirochaetaceae bacterium]|jgi:16S rRNA (uracil1498-N3)-methyltransferase|nr:16S rRNA (uracil(1498)-N(3))-methyltransferase [Spirochaetaceae bacterium]
MRQLLLPRAPDSEGRLRLKDGDYHYLASVLRYKTGDRLTVTMPSGKAASAVIVSVSREEIELSVESAAQNETEEELPRIILIQAVPKGAKLDLIVRQAVECGVSEILPLLSSRVVRKGGNAAVQTERLRRIVREARQQSGSPVPTIVHEPFREKAVFEYWQSLEGGSLGLLLLPPLEEAQFTALAHSSLHGYLRTDYKHIVIAVGPEGGYSPNEAAGFIAAGFKPLSLAKTVLRCETAALFALAAVRIVLLEKNSWIYQTVNE